MKSVRIAVLVLFVVTVAGSIIPAALPAQQTSCALDARAEGDATTRYRPRGDRNRSARCEGLYVGLQSAPLNLQVISLVRGSLEFDAGDTVEVAVPDQLTGVDAVESSLIVLGRSRQANLYWALDASRQLGQNLEWPTNEVVEPAGLEPEQLGLFARASDSAGDPVYVPVAVHSSHASQHDSIEFVFRIPAAGRACWRFDFPPDDPNPPPCVRADPIGLAGAEGADGYFRARLPPVLGARSIRVRWAERYRHRWSEVPEQIVIYGW